MSEPFYGIRRQLWMFQRRVLRQEWKWGCDVEIAWCKMLRGIYIFGRSWKWNEQINSCGLAMQICTHAPYSNSSNPIFFYMYEICPYICPWNTSDQATGLFHMFSLRQVDLRTRFVGLIQTFRGRTTPKPADCARQIPSFGPYPFLRPRFSMSCLGTFGRCSQRVRGWLKIGVFKRASLAIAICHCVARTSFEIFLTCEWH